MKKHRQTKKQFSLKDELFNQRKVRKLAAELQAVWPEFDARGFEKAVLGKFSKQELMERVRGIRDELRNFLPKDYSRALSIILKALPKELDPKKTDNDFGDFIYAPYTYFVATYGCSEKHVDRSLAALREMTKRFSAEGALRDFLNAFPKETLVAVEGWSRDSNYHVRRLSSEGTRPNLPWAKKITIKPKQLVKVLDRLHADKTRYVVRSVANHVNDITKVDPKLALQLLKKWNRAKKQTEKELAYLTNHALRTLVKDGHKEALKLIGYDSKHIEVKSFKLTKSKVKVGETLQFSFVITSISDKPQALLLDYLIYFNKANGKLAPKTFKIAKKKVGPGEKITIEKNHPLKLMSTRTLYPGEHAVELQINGQTFGKKSLF